MNTWDFYEKLYFHELERKEQIISRLQLPLAMIVTTAGFIGYLIGIFELKFDNTSHILFWGSLVLANVFLAAATYQFFHSLLGSTYRLLPTAMESDKYLAEMLELYKPYRRGKKIAKRHFEEYIFSYFKDCSSTNCEVNDKRLGYTSRSIALIIPAIFFSLLTYSIFFLGGLEKTKPDQVHKVLIQSPTTKEVTKMSDEDDSKQPSSEAPPPPPPPPARVIREDAPPNDRNLKRPKGD